MDAAIFAKSVRDRWISITVAAGTLALFLLFAMAIYGDIDLSLYTNLPEAMRSLMGIPTGADAAALAYNVMLGTIASLTLAGLAISIGASAIAGEERDGTLGLLLGNPRSRSQVLRSKAASMLALIALAALLLWGAGLGTPAVLGVEIGATQVGAMVLHLAVNALFYGFLALAIGAWTGNRPLASGAAVVVMVVSFVGTGLVPLIDEIADLVRALPWYYFDGSQPLLNGIDWGHLGVLGGGTVLFAAAALVGVNRRDLRGRNGGASLVDRLRAHPATHAAMERLAGSTRVSHIWVKTASEHQGIVALTALVMFSMMGLLIGVMYTFIDDALVGFADSVPESFLALAGGGDMSTPEGFYQIETFGLMAPIAVILVTVVIGSRALAGEEARHTMGLLLANPIRRRRVVFEKAAVMVLFAAIVGLATFAGVALGSLLAGLDLSIANVAAISTLVTLLGLVFGGLALALGAATGRVRVAVYGSVGAAIAFHVVNAYLPLNPDLADLARISPFYYYLGADPLNTGMPWDHAAVLTGLAVVLIAAAVPLFERRDLRTRG